MAFGAAWITAVALKDIAAEVDGVRSIPALASALAWLGSGVGGILMGWLADKVGIRWTVICGALMIGLGLSISTLGPPWPLWVGHGLFIGLIGLGGINAPMYIYVSRWFDRRRGSALALISSGSYLAGAMWPPLFERAIAAVGWRHTMMWYAVLEIAVIVPQFISARRLK
jgi:MFS family permease